MIATYRKLRSGDWGVQCQGTPKAGDVVLVQTRAGAAGNHREGLVQRRRDLDLCHPVVRPGVDRPGFNRRRPGVRRVWPWRSARGRS